MENAHLPRLVRGQSPLLISVPHAGTAVPPPVFARLSAAGSELPDTDWFVDRLYEWAPDFGAGMIVAPLSRYVVDLNRPPDDQPLYTASETSLLTGLVPLKTFAGAAVYLPGCEPDPPEVRNRVDAYWQPYHRSIREELERITARHGHAVLLDAHSIRSHVPLLFDGALPDLNLGTNAGRSAHHTLRAAAHSALKDGKHSLALDGRFKGGYITRHYGDPGSGVHALQLEMAQSAYMQEAPPLWQPERAESIQALLRGLARTLVDWVPADD